MSSFGRWILLVFFSGVVLMAGCGKKNDDLLNAVNSMSPSPSMAILETPDEIAIELPPSVSAGKPLPALQKSEPATTLSSQN